MEVKVTLEVPEISVIQKKDKPNSYEFGKATSRHKVYYDDQKDLQSQLDFLNEMGLIEEI